MTRNRNSTAGIFMTKDIASRKAEIVRARHRRISEHYHVKMNVFMTGTSTKVRGSVHKQQRNISRRRCETIALYTRKIEHLKRKASTASSKNNWEEYMRR